MCGRGSLMMGWKAHADQMMIERAPVIASEN